MSVLRGCGHREKGGVYFECNTGPGGAPIEEFLVDPPQQVDTRLLCKAGIKLVNTDGVWHILDWIGHGFYPNVADFIEEARRFGVSRRLRANLDFSKITPESRLLCVHARAWIENAGSWPDIWTCPKEISAHASNQHLA